MTTGILIYFMKCLLYNKIYLNYAYFILAGRKLGTMKVLILSTLRMLLSYSKQKVTTLKGSEWNLGPPIEILETANMVFF